MKFSKFLAAAAGVGLALSACSAHPGAALNIDGKSYTDKQISQAATQLSELTGQKLNNMYVAQFLSVSPGVQDVVKEQKLPAAEAQVRQQIARQQQAGQFKQGKVSDLSVRFLQTMTVLNGLGQQKSALVFEKNAKHKISLSPRYGKMRADGRPGNALPSNVVTAADPTSGSR